MKTVFHNSHFALFFGAERRRVTRERDVSDLARDHANYTASRIADHLSLLSGAEYIRGIPPENLSDALQAKHSTLWSMV